MIKQHSYTLLSLTIALILSGTSCSGDSIIEETAKQRIAAQHAEETARVTTHDALYLGAKTVRFHITAEAGQRSKGIVFSTTNPQPTIRIGEGTRYVMTKDESDRTNMAYGSYYYRAYAIYNTEVEEVRDTVYGEVKQLDVAVQYAEMESYPVFNRVRVAAIVCGRFLNGKADATEWGACISESVNPTVNNTKVKAPDFNATTGDFGVLFDNLKPLKLYHTRIYAKYDDGKVVYGEDRIFQTTRGGDVSWRWASNEAGAKTAITDGVSAYDRITEAMDSAMYYYHNYSNLYIRSSVEYNTGVQTADCSFGGWIRFGPTTRYQWVGTAQHELCHGFGVGTANNWQTLIQYSGAKKWREPYAQLTQRVVLKDQTQDLKGDTQHFWSGGINQREEVTNGTTNSYGVNIRNAEMLKANALIMNGMVLDGLSTPRP